MLDVVTPNCNPRMLQGYGRQRQETQLGAHKAAAGGRRELVSENVFSDLLHIYHDSHTHTYMLSPQVVGTLSPSGF